MTGKKVLLIVVAWMAVLVAGWAVLGGESDEGSNGNPAAKTGQLTQTTGQPPSANAPAQTEPTQTQAQTQTQTPAPTKEAIGVPMTAEEAATTDPHERDPRQMREMRKIERRYALLQDLPYSENGYTFDHVDVAANGRMLLRMHYPGSKAEAVKLYQTLLERSNDSGAEYEVEYVAR
jgi:hypothetical protein